MKHGKSEKITDFVEKLRGSSTVGKSVRESEKIQIQRKYKFNSHFNN